MSNYTPEQIDLRNLIHADLQFEHRGETDLKIDELQALVARGWMQEGDENNEFDVTDDGRAALQAALAQNTQGEAVACHRFLGQNGEAITEWEDGLPDNGKRFPDLCPPIGSVQYAYFRHAERARVPDGYVLVPRELTLQMKQAAHEAKHRPLEYAGDRGIESWFEMPERVWTAMLAAAPSQTEDAGRWLVDKKTALSYLAGNAILEFGRPSEGARLINYHGAVPQTLLITLQEEGWIESLSNGEGARISPAGMRSYNRAMDEMGDGKLVAPKRTTQPKDAG